MEIQQNQLDQLSRLLQSSLSTSKEISDISGIDKRTITLIGTGATLLITGILYALKE